MLIIKEIQVKITKILPYNHQDGYRKKRSSLTSADKDVEKLEPLNTVGGIVKQCNGYGKQFGSCSKNLKQLPNDLGILLLGTYIKELKAELQRDICTPMVLAALVTRAKKWRQQKCPSTADCINKMWSTHTREYYSTLKRKFQYMLKHG